MDEAFLGSLVSSLPDAVISINRASVIVHANEAAFQLFGFARENFIGQSLADTIIPRDLGPQHMRLDTARSSVVASTSMPAITRAGAFPSSSASFSTATVPARFFTQRFAKPPNALCAMQW